MTAHPFQIWFPGLLCLSPLSFSLNLEIVIIIIVTPELILSLLGSFFLPGKLRENDINDVFSEPQEIIY